MRYNNIIIIGTSHIARESLKEVSKLIEVERPGIIAVELDKKRLMGLMSKSKSSISISRIKKVGMKGYLFGMLGSYVQKKLGKDVGVARGSDMLTAVELAQNYKIELALIDQDIDITLARFSEAITFREKWRFLVDIFRGICFKKSEMKKMGLEEIDLNKVPPKRLIKKLIDNVKDRYPNLYRVLISERNFFMAKKLYELQQLYPHRKILAVVGAGHEEELIALLKKIDTHQVEFLK